MFSLFLNSASSAFINLYGQAGHKDALFDFNYLNDKGAEASLTYQDRGIFYAFRLYDENNKPGPVQLINSQEYKYKISDSESLQFQFSQGIINARGHIMPQLTVNYFGYYEKKIDIGVFFDCNFKDGETNTITNIDGEVDHNRGLRVTSKDTYEYALLLNNSGFGPYPDTRYVGDLGNSVHVEPSFYPFFKNGIAKNTGSNSVIAFAWTNQSMLPNTPKFYRYVVAVSKTINTAPIIIDRTEYKPIEEYKVGDVINFKFQIISYDVNEMSSYRITLEDLTNGDTKQQKNKFKPTKDNFIVNITFDPYTLTEGGVNVYGDVKDLSQQITNIDIEIHPYVKPTFKSMTFTSKKEFYYTEKISYSGVADTPTKSNVLYQIGNGPILEANNGIVGGKQFSGKISIPPSLKRRQNYTVRFYVQYSSSRSDPQEFTFYLRDQESPEFISLYSSDYAYTRGKTDIVIIGEAHDQEEAQTLFIYSKLDKLEKNRVNLGKFINDPTRPFAMYLEMPKDISTGIHDVEFDIMDDTDLMGKQNRTVSIRVCNEGEVCYEPGEEPTAAPSSGPVSPIQPSTNAANIDKTAADKDYKSKMPVIWVLTVFNLIAVLILLVIGVIYLRKRMNTYDAFEDNTTTEGDEEISESCITPAPGSVSQTVDNPLFSTGIPQSDDVFATDYHEETTVDVFKFNHDEEDPDLGI